MSCEKFQRWMSLALDGELAESKRAKLQAHLSTCESCRKLYEEWAATGALLRKQPVVIPQTPQQAWSAVRVRIKEQTQEVNPVFGWRLRWVAAIMLVFFIGAGVLFTVQRAGLKSAALPGETVVEWVETDVPGGSPMVYVDAESGWTIIWVAGLEGKTGS